MIIIMCIIENETVSHITSECTMLAKNKYKKVRQCMQVYSLETAKNRVLKDCHSGTKTNCTGFYGILQSSAISKLARQWDIVIIDKSNKEVKITNVTILGELLVNEREIGMTEQDKIKDEVTRRRDMEKATVMR